MVENQYPTESVLTCLTLTGNQEELADRTKYEYVTELLGSQQDVNQKLNTMFGSQFDVRFSVIAEPNDVPIWYLFVYSSKVISEWDYRPVLNRHYQNCSIADEALIDYEDMIEIRVVGEDGDHFNPKETLLPPNELDSVDRGDSIGSWVASQTLHDSEYPKYLWSPTFRSVLDDAQSPDDNGLQVNGPSSFPYSLGDPRLFAERF